MYTLMQTFLAVLQEYIKRRKNHRICTKKLYLIYLCDVCRVFECRNSSMPDINMYISTHYSALAQGLPHTLGPPNILGGAFTRIKNKQDSVTQCILLNNTLLPLQSSNIMFTP